jgi:OPA family glycerol-3-phosphate transporter-like MFS transporter
MFGAVIAEVGMGRVVDRWGWDGGFKMLLISCVLAILLLALTWKKHHEKD